MDITNWIWPVAHAVFAIGGIAWVTFELGKYPRAQRYTQIALVLDLAQAIAGAYLQVLTARVQNGVESYPDVAGVISILAEIRSPLAFASLIFLLMAILANRAREQESV